MGWTFSPSWTRKSLIDELTEPTWNNLGEWITLKRCYKGGPGAGTLWTVVRFTRRGTNDYQDYIMCYLLRYRSGEWGYKDIEESMGPYVYTCPISYLQMVPMPDHPFAKNWRRNVAAYHWRKKKEKEAKVLTP